MMSAAGTFLAPIVRRRTAPAVLRSTRTGRVLASKVEGAFDSATRRRGLLDRESLDVGEALIIAPCQAVHTFFMKFDIDVLFVARDGRVVGIRERLRRGRIAAAWRAFAVVELAAGAVAAAGIVPGESLVLEAPPLDGAGERSSSAS